VGAVDGVEFGRRAEELGEGGLVMEEDVPSFWKRPMFWGIVGTCLVFGIGLIAATSPSCPDQSANEMICLNKWRYLMQATPNELGDTLAGFAGALAFIWIIVPVALQGQELKATRIELRYTRKETKRTADALAEQVAVLQDEQLQRDQNRAAQLLTEIMSDLETVFKKCRIHIRADDDSKDFSPTVLSNFSFEKYDEQLKLEHHVRAIGGRLPSVIVEIQTTVLEPNIPFFLMNGRDHLAQVSEFLEKIISLRPRLAEDQTHRLNLMRIEYFYQHLKILLNLRIWSAQYRCEAR
jgi:hypothetical protein